MISLAADLFLKHFLRPVELGYSKGLLTQSFSHQFITFCSVLLFPHPLFVTLLLPNLYSSFGRGTLGPVDSDTPPMPSTDLSCCELASVPFSLHPFAPKAPDSPV